MQELKDVHDDALLRRAKELAAQDHRTTAELLEHLAEIELRRLHLKLGYDSMKAYCVREFHYSESAARRRIHAANVARKFPILFDAVADGRLHLSAIIVLAPYLTAANADKLIAAAAHKGKEQIEVELARRFPQAESLRLDDGLSPQVVVRQRLNVEPCALERTVSERPDASPQPKSVPARLAPITIERYSLQVTIDAETHDELRQIQNLLGHPAAPRAVADVLKKCVHMMLVDLRRRKFAEVDRPRQSRTSMRPRAISAQVKRAVHQRDGDRCAYVGESGHRCGSPRQLEYDHIVPVAKGGRSSVENVRLVCRIHNQFAADQAFGREFMDRKRVN